MREFGTAVILAGGQSSRMGFDKQLLGKGNQSLIKRIRLSLGARFDDIIIVTNTPELYEGNDVRVITDIVPGMGPLGGIHAALTHSSSESIFVIACDMPYIDLPYLDYMKSIIKGNRYDACVTEDLSSKGRYQAFHSFYYRSALPVIEADLRAQKASMYYLLRKINTKVISFDQARPYITVRNLFLNLNTHDEYEKYLFLEDIY
ncbi:MAG: molybdenum cofactor guanylyltransferase [Bacillota bacterium]|jgi:molybdopterin-guanine dinucleotide biosynthesis protein A